MSLLTASPSVGSGARKAAILLIQLGSEHTAAVLNHLSETEVEAVMAEIAQLEAISPEDSSAVLSEFRDLATARAHIKQGGLAFARAALEQSMGAERAADLVNRIAAATIHTPFRFLHSVEPAQLRSFLGEEHPQVVALVLAHLTPDRASLVLAGMSPELQAEIAHRIAAMDRTSPDLVAAVERTLERRVTSVIQPSEMLRLGGLDPLVEIINRADRSTERQIVEGLESLDPALAEQIRSKMFLFDDIVSIEDRSLQLVFREVDPAELALALKGVSDAVREKVVGNLSERAAVNLLEEVELLGAVRLAQVEEAQQNIIRVIRRLEEQGQLVIRRGNDDEFVD